MVIRSIEERLESGMPRIYERLRWGIQQLTVGISFVKKTLCWLYKSTSFQYRSYKGHFPGREVTTVSSSSRTTILFVDDDPCMREVMAMVLGEEGYEVSTAGDGFDALAQMRSSLPDLILSDLHMPGMSGVEFLSVVRRRFPAIPVVAISGACGWSDSLPTGVMADAFYPKGRCHPNELLRTIEDLIRMPLSRATNYHLCSPPHTQTARSMRNANGVPEALLTCTECLRAFTSEAAASSEPRVQVAYCRFCNTLVQFLPEAPRQVLSGVIHGGEQARASAA